MFRITTEATEKLRSRVDPITHPTLAHCRGTARPARIVKRGRKKRLLSRDMLDGRCVVTKVFDELTAAIHSDLGGRSELSAIELGMVEAFVGSKVMLDHLNARVLAGAEIDNALVTAYTSALSGMVKVASRLGTARRARAIPDLDSFLAARAKAKREATEREAIESEPTESEIE